MRLAHPSPDIVNKVSQFPNLVGCKYDNNSICTICPITKSHRLPFQSKHAIYSHAFDLIYMDDWTTLVLSSTIAKYFLHIV